MKLLPFVVIETRGGTRGNEVLGLVIWCFSLLRLGLLWLFLCLKFIYFGFKKFYEFG